MKSIRIIAGFILLIVCTSGLFAQTLSKSVSWGGITVSFPKDYTITDKSEDEDGYTVESRKATKSGWSNVNFCVFKQDINLANLSEEEKMAFIKKVITYTCEALLEEVSIEDLRLDAYKTGTYGEYSGLISFTATIDGDAAFGAFIAIYNEGKLVLFETETTSIKSERDNIHAIIKSIQWQ